MLFECALLADNMIEAGLAKNEKLRAKIDDRLGFLTPILKGFLTEKGLEAANLGVQIFGGHGYIKENKMEQVVRDVRIATLWEGTTGIQALDLLGRKVLLQKLSPINTHCAMIYKYCQPLLLNSALRKHAWTVMRHALEWQTASVKIALKAASDKDVVGVASVDYLLYSGYINLAYHWLKMEEAARKGLANGGSQSKEFYEAKILTSNFYFDVMLPRTRSLYQTMFAPVSSIMSMKEEQFSS